MKDYRLIIAERIKNARSTIEMSQAALARKTGIFQSTICRIEKGERLPSVPQIILLADALNVSADYILGTNDTPYSFPLCFASEYEYRDFKTAVHLLSELIERREVQ